MLEDRRSRSSRKTPDLVTDELILILHEAGMLEFNDIFQRTVVVMKAKHMSLGGEEILRLRIYEKLQNLVSAGGLMKKGREYTNNLLAVMFRQNNEEHAPIARG